MKIMQLAKLAKTKLILSFSLLLLYLFSGMVGAVEPHLSGFLVPYTSYTYDYWDKAVPAPHAYLPKRMITAAELGIDSLNLPGDLVIDAKSNIYIADTGNNRIVHLDSNWKVVRIIDHFINEDKKDTFVKPKSLAVSSNQHIYIADTGNGRIVHLDQNGNLVEIFGPPQAKFEGIFPSDFLYRPIKVGVNNNGHLFILSEDFFDGFITLDADGVFHGLIGAPKVTMSLADYIWSFIATKEQRERRLLYLPTEYSSFTMDEKGFLYATVTSDEDKIVRRLNPAGADSLTREGFHEPIGDVNYAGRWSSGTYTGRSTFQDITILPYEVYCVLDSTRGRVFTYDNDGNLLFVFGYRGRNAGQLGKAIAIDNIGYDLVLLDSELGRIVIFEPTEYTNLIWKALGHYDKGEYLLAEETWRSLLRLNANYDLAYTGIGRSLFLQKKYDEAMYYFKLGNNRKGYSRAFKEYREIKMQDSFGMVMTGILIAVALFIFLRSMVRKYRRRSAYQIAVSSEAKWLAASQGTTFKDKVMTLVYNLKYSLHVILHPFDGFYELKYRNRGSLGASFIILFLLSITYILMHQYTGFIFNHRDPSRLNILTEFASVFLPFALWVGVNWALTALMEGKGTLRDIIIASSYALVPLILINLPLIFISNYFTLEEGAFYYMIMSFAVMWSMMLMFLGAVMTTHEYGFAKSFATAFFTLLGMVFTLFLGVLFFNLLEQVTVFFNEVITEIMYRV